MDAVTPGRSNLAESAVTHAEPLRLDSHVLRQSHIKIREVLVSPSVEGQMPLVPQAAARHDDRQIFATVAGGVAQVASMKDRGPAEKSSLPFPGRFHRGEEPAKFRHLGFLDDR